MRECLEVTNIRKGISFVSFRGQKLAELEIAEQHSKNLLKGRKMEIVCTPASVIGAWTMDICLQHAGDPAGGQSDVDPVRSFVKRRSVVENRTAF